MKAKIQLPAISCTKRKLPPDEVLISLYFDKKLSGSEIGKLYNCTSTTVYLKLKRLGFSLEGKRCGRVESSYGFVTITSEPFTKFLTKKSNQKTTMVRGQCVCGTERDFSLSHLKEGGTVSCGCKAKEINAARLTTHGLTSHPLFDVWHGMKQRCYYPKMIQFWNYGGRGISVCDEWRNDFKVFYDWCMANGWKQGLVIDRKDNDGNYEPSNCRFLTMKESNRNRTVVKLNMEKANEIRNLFASGALVSELSSTYGVSVSHISGIVNNKHWV